MASPADAALPPVAPQTADQAIAQDAAEYARRFHVDVTDAARRLRAQQASAAITDAIRQHFKARVAGISIDHQPTYRISVLLTGSEPVPVQWISAGGMAVPVVFRTGARATGDEIIRAMLVHGPALTAMLPQPRGMGLDERSGELVLLVTTAAAASHDLGQLRADAEQIAGVPVRIDLADRAIGDLAVAGGARIEGVDPANGKRYACTTGYAVTDGARTGIVTAAHCPDNLTYYDPDGGSVPLGFDGQWGARTQDVQVHPIAIEQPLFYANRRNGSLRTVTGSRRRLSTRAGEWLCHWGESSGFSCAQVVLTNFAPPAMLCAGPCAPTWVTVEGPNCRSGDSGGPIFSGSVAFGITKGGSGGRGTRCNFYFYMSTDFLPTGWRLIE